MQNEIKQRRQQVLFDEKWIAFLRRARLFKYIPFVDAAFGAGSMAMGNVTNTSDFDVLIAARSGRIFTARFFSAFFFALFGWRRSKMDHRTAASNKICLNHFVTAESFKLNLPVNAYWQQLYQKLTPVYGEKKVIEEFFDKNKEWIGAPLTNWQDRRYRYTQSAMLKRGLEKILSGGFGSWLERQLKRFQVKRIERSLAAAKTHSAAHTIVIGEGGIKEVIELAPIIHYSDTELQFHPDPARIELYHS